MTHPMQARVERADWWRDHLRSRCRRGLDRKPMKRLVLIPQVTVAVCEYYGISPEDLLGRDREAEVVRARQIAMFLARTMTGRSYPEIGRQMGGFDHSTVLHSYRKIRDLVPLNAEVSKDVDAIAGAVLSGW